MTSMRKLKRKDLQWMRWHAKNGWSNHIVATDGAMKIYNRIVRAENRKANRVLGPELRRR